MDSLWHTAMADAAAIFAIADVDDDNRLFSMQDEARLVGWMDGSVQVTIIYCAVNY